MIDIYELSDKEMLERIGENFKRIRLLINISQKKIAEKSGISLSTIKRFEKGEPISTLYLVRLFRAINRLDELDKLFIVPGFSSREMRMLSNKIRKRASRNH